MPYVALGDPGNEIDTLQIHKYFFNLYSKPMLVYGHVNDLPCFPCWRQYLL